MWGAPDVDATKPAMRLFFSAVFASASFEPAAAKLRAGGSFRNNGFQELSVYRSWGRERKRESGVRPSLSIVVVLRVAQALKEPVDLALEVLILGKQGIKDCLLPVDPVDRAAQCLHALIHGQ